MMTGDEYRDSLRDGRFVMLEGEKIEDLPNHPVFTTPIDLQASLYDKGYDPAPDAVRDSTKRITSPEDLREHALALEETDMLSEVTNASLMTLLTAAGRIEEQLPENASA